jgi:uncharacterized protein YkwD
MKTFIFLVILAVLLSCGKSSSDSSRTKKQESVSDSSYFSLMNEYRMKLGLKPLILSALIQDIALEHSEWMADGAGPFGHEGWKERCRRLRVEYDAAGCGEIVARGQKTPEEALEAWLSSPPHRKSLENPAWTHTGIGISTSASGQVYWTQMFLKVR